MLRLFVCLFCYEDWRTEERKRSAPSAAPATRHRDGRRDSAAVNEAEKGRARITATLTCNWRCAKAGELIGKKNEEKTRTRADSLSFCWLPPSLGSKVANSSPAICGCTWLFQTYPDNHPLQLGRNVLQEKMSTHLHQSASPALDKKQNLCWTSPCLYLCSLTFGLRCSPSKFVSCGFVSSPRFFVLP